MRPVDRSMNVSLTEGMVDGKIKKTLPDRGGLPEQTSVMHRQNLITDYGIMPGEANASDARPDVVGCLP